MSNIEALRSMSDSKQFDARSNVTPKSFLCAGPPRPLPCNCNTPNPRPCRVAEPSTRAKTK